MDHRLSDPEGYAADSDIITLLTRIAYLHSVWSVPAGGQAKVADCSGVLGTSLAKHVRSLVGVHWGISLTGCWSSFVQTPLLVVNSLYDSWQVWPP